MGDFDLCTSVQGESQYEIPPLNVFNSNPVPLNQGRKQYLVGSLTGAVALRKLISVNFVGLYNSNVI